MPLFVPIIIGAAVAGLTGYGGKKGYDGLGAKRQAKAIGEAAEKRHKRHLDLLDSAHKHFTQKCAETDALRKEIWRSTLGRLMELMQALERKGHARTLQNFARFGVQPEQVQAFTAHGIESGPTMRGVLSAAGAGAGASALATGLVSSFATASTGTAISGLSGAAAQSATLAWLGGGSLAAGGGGMFVGTAMLGGITVAPAVAIGGFVLAAQGEKALTKATEYEANVNEEIARINRLIAFLHRAETRADELQNVMRRLDARASAALDEAFAMVDEFDDNNDVHIGKLSTTMLLCKALSELLHVKVLNDKNELSPDFDDFVARYRVIVEDA